MKKTSIKLDGPALEAALRIRDLHRAIEARREALQAEINQKFAAFQASAVEEMKAQWAQLPVPSGDPKEWMLDFSYASHGCVFLNPNVRDLEAPEPLDPADLIAASLSKKH